MSNNKQDHIVDSNKMVSSVEWLVKELNQKIDFIPMNKWDEIRGVVQQAKAMHKEEIVDACNQKEFQDLDGYGIHETISKGEDYYNETYGGNNE